MTDLNYLREKVSKTFYLPNNRGEINWEWVCLLSTTSQPVVMQADIQSVHLLFWGHCLWDCVCCQMLPCNWKETVWTLLPPAAAAGTSGMLALSGALLTRLFIHSTFFPSTYSPCVKLLFCSTSSPRKKFLIRTFFRMRQQIIFLREMVPSNRIIEWVELWKYSQKSAARVQICARLTVKMAVKKTITGFFSSCIMPNFSTA